MNDIGKFSFVSGYILFQHYIESLQIMNLLHSSARIPRAINLASLYGDMKGELINFWEVEIYLQNERLRFMKLTLILLALLAATGIPSAAEGDTAEYWSSLGDQQLYNGSIEEAARSYDKALELDPGNVNLWNRKGYAFGILGRYEDAVASFDQALAINSTNVEALNWKGLALYRGLDRHDEAIACFDKVLVLNASDSEAWNGKGMALADKGDLSGSLVCLQMATKLDPLNPGAWNNEGVVLRELGKYQEALECFDKALLLDPNNQAAQTNRNSTLEDMNRIVQLGTGQWA